MLGRIQNRPGPGLGLQAWFSERLEVPQAYTYQMFKSNENFLTTVYIQATTTLSALNVVLIKMEKAKYYLYYEMTTGNFAPLLDG